MNVNFGLFPPLPTPAPAAAAAATATAAYTDRAKADFAAWLAPADARRSA